MDKQSRLQKAFTISVRAGGLLSQLQGLPALRTAGQTIGQFALCAILARGSILGSFSPFGVAMVSAFCAQGRGFPAVLGAFFGYLVLGNSDAGVGNCAAALLTLACSHICLDFGFASTRWFMPLVASVCMGACGFVFLPPFSLPSAILFCCMVVLTFCTAYFYLTALTPPRAQNELFRPIAILVLLATLLVSVYDLTLPGGISPARVAALALVMGAAYLGGSGNGAATGVAFGVTMDAAMGHGVFFSCVYGFGALIGGVFHSANKMIFAASYLCAGTAASLLGVDDPIFLSALGESVIAAFVFALIPAAVWDSLRDAIFPVPQDVTSTVRHVRQSAQRYASEASEAFYQMYLGMMSGLSHGKTAGREQARAVFDKAADKVCRQCTLCNACWEKDYVSTLSALNDVTMPMLTNGRTQAKDFPHHFAARCIRFPEFLRASNEALLSLQQRQEYREKCDENRSLIAQQYAGLTGILRQMGAGFSQDVTSLPMRERQVRRYAAAFGRVEDVAVYRDGNGRLRIELGGAEIDVVLEQKQGFTAGLAALLSVGLTEPCVIADELGRRLLLREQAPYRAVVGLAQRKKPGETVSGDSGRSFVTEDGRACLLLSDGMGTGENAARDSAEILDQLERFLCAGIPARDALATISPAFRMQCEGMRFVTLDVLTVDLFTGEAESLKCGAAPSYCKTAGGVTRIVSQALPVGLADDKGDAVPLRFGHGDCYIMVTDGITDGTDDGFLLEIVAARAGDGAKALATQLVAEAGARGSTDDMTALILRLERSPQPGSGL